MLKRCTRCGAEKPLDTFHSAKLGAHGRMSVCKPCRAEQARGYYEAKRAELIPKHREYRKQNADAVNARGRAKYARNRETRLKKSKERNERERDKRLARQAVAAAIRSGDLVRPRHCARCSAATFVQAHHPSYAPDRRLDVEWLCTTCHARVGTEAA